MGYVNLVHKGRDGWSKLVEKIASKGYNCN